MPTQARYLWFSLFLSAIIAGIGGSSLEAALEAAQVLVVYHAPENDPQSDGFRIWNYYQASRPGVRGMNLARHLPEGRVLPSGTISYPDYVSHIRNPIRRHLLERGLENVIRVIVLTKNIPHRIDDLNHARAGDSPNRAHNLFQEGNATFASVDSELTLLWRDLEGSEAERSFDSHADNYVQNPYFRETVSINAFTPNARSSSLTFERSEKLEWRLVDSDSSEPVDAGWIYLTARLDGENVEDIKQMIERAKTIHYDVHEDAMILDRSLDGQLDEGDFESAASRYALVWDRLINDKSSAFLVGSSPGSFVPGANEVRIISGPIAVVASYGGNHSRTLSQAGWESTFEGQLVNGAIFNSYESYNGKRFGDAGSYGDQAQVSRWIHHGGTFGLGHVWEPLSASVGRNHILLESFLFKGLTWVEAAWSSLPFLSWQNVVVGDPLATATGNFPPLVSLVKLEGHALEFESDQGLHKFMLTLSERVSRPLRIGLRFTGALPGRDYRTTNLAMNEGAAFVTIPSYQKTTMFTVKILDDDLHEGLETLTIGLAASSRMGYHFLQPQTATIPIAE